MSRAIAERTAPLIAQLLQLEPQCPKRCEVATPPEKVRDGRYVCSGCGTEFSWPRP